MSHTTLHISIKFANMFAEGLFSFFGIITYRKKCLKSTAEAPASSYAYIQLCGYFLLSQRKEMHQLKTSFRWVVVLRKKFSTNTPTRHTNTYEQQCRLYGGEALTSCKCFNCLLSIPNLRSRILI
jgi:hypothetical protein